MQYIKHVFTTTAQAHEGSLVTLQSREESFTGHVLVAIGDHQTLPAVVQDGNTYAIRVGTSGNWDSKYDHRYVIVKLDDTFYNESFSLVESATTAQQIINIVKEHLQKVQHLTKHLHVNNTSVPSGPNTSTFSASKNGSIKTASNYWNRGGSYEGNTYCVESLQVGGALSIKDQYYVSALAMMVISKAQQRVGNFSCWFKDGTNYNTVALIQY